MKRRYQMRIGIEVPVHVASALRCKVLTHSIGNIARGCSDTGSYVVLDSMWEKRKLSLNLVWGGPNLGGNLCAIAWSPDGEYLVVGRAVAMDAEVLMFKRMNRNFEAVWRMGLHGHGEVRGISWSPDGRYIAFTTSKAKLIVVDVCGKELTYIDEHSMKRSFFVRGSTSWSKHGLVVAGEDFVALYKFKHNEFEKVWEISEGTLIAHAEEKLREKVNHVFFNRVLLLNDVVLGIGYAVRVRSGTSAFMILAKDGKVLNVYGPREFGLPIDKRTSLNDAGLSLSGRYLAVVTSKGIVIYRVVGSGFEEVSRGGKEWEAYSLTWIGDEAIVVGSSLRELVLYSFDGEKLELLHRYGIADHPPESHGLDYNPRIGLLATITNRIYVFDVGKTITAIEKLDLRKAIAEEHKVLSYGYDTANLLNIPIPSFINIDVPTHGLFRTFISPSTISKDLCGEWLCVKLGCGGWGCTYKCERGGMVVVFKVPRGLEDIVEKGIIPTMPEEKLRRVIEEAETLSKLSHPHILKLLGYSTKIPLLIYEYADGGNLEQQCAGGWNPSLRDVVLIGIQLADALRYIHSRGLVHGDIKPTNVFVVNRIVKIGDFSSLVKLLSETSSHSHFTYTPGWRAPEHVDIMNLRRRARELGYENRIDIYQLGNLLLYLLTREKVDGENRILDEKGFEELLSKVEHGELRKVIRVMMEVEPWKRPSADEVVKILTRAYHELRR